MPKQNKLAAIKNPWSKFRVFRKITNAYMRKQHDLYVKNLAGDNSTNPRDFYRYVGGPKKVVQYIPPLK